MYNEQIRPQLENFNITFIFLTEVFFLVVSSQKSQNVYNFDMKMTIPNCWSHLNLSSGKKLLDHKTIQMSR